MGEPQVLELSEVQITDYPNPRSLRYMTSISLYELLELGMPQVWEVDGKLLVSGGNQKTLAYALRGHDKILVDYEGDPGSFRFCLFDVEERAQKLQSWGLVTPYDFLNLVDL